jgi:hypothetical protein
MKNLFEWQVPHVPEDKNVFITASRMQHTPQDYRLWILPRLLQANTFEKLAETLNKLLIKREGPEIQSEKWFRKLIFDKQKGIIKQERISTFSNRLKGITVVREEAVVKRKFTRKEIENHILFFKNKYKDNNVVYEKNIKSFNDVLKKLSGQDEATLVSEVEFIKPSKIIAGKKHISPSDARYILDQTFSLLSRSAGGRLAGVPLTTLHKNVFGITTGTARKIESEIREKYSYGGIKGENSFSITKRRIRIGQPYTDRLIESAKLITQVIDAVARHIDSYINRQSILGTNLFSAEKLSEYALDNLTRWMKEKDTFKYNGSRSRVYQNMDFFFIPDKELRRKIIKTVQQNNNLMTDSLKKILIDKTNKGLLQLAVVDISGGGGTTGLSEFVSKLLGYKKAGSIDAYINSITSTYKNFIGRSAGSIILCPRKDDLTLTSIEYMPIINELKRRKIKCHIVLAEQLEESLQSWNGRAPFTTVAWDKQIVRPELIAKRFTFLGEGVREETDRGYIRAKLPPGVMIIPSPASRIPASDKRINSKVLEILKDKLHSFGVVVIPTKVINIIDSEKLADINKKINGSTGNETASLIKLKKQYISCGVMKVIKEIAVFAKDNREEWPEIDFLGLIMKLDDKRPGRKGKGGELVSAYPIAASILKILDNNSNCVDNILKDGSLSKQEIYIKEILVHKIFSLVDKGVANIIIQPNVLSIFADGKDFMETKIFVYADPKKHE